MKEPVSNYIFVQFTYCEKLEVSHYLFYKLPGNVMYISHLCRTILNDVLCELETMKETFQVHKVN